MVDLDDNNINYKDINNYELFLMLFQSYKDFDTLNYVFGLNKKLYQICINDKNERFVCDENLVILIDVITYNEISIFLNEINCIKKEEKYNFGNEISRKKYIAQQRKKRQRDMVRAEKLKNDNKKWLDNLVSAIVWSNESSYTFDNIYKLTIYQLMDGIKRINKLRDVYYKTMAVYNGNIEQKKLKESDFNWAGKL